MAFRAKIWDFITFHGAFDPPVHIRAYQALFINIIFYPAASPLLVLISHHFCFVTANIEVNKFTTVIVISTFLLGKLRCIILDV